MSNQGIKKFAKILSILQEERGELIKLGCSTNATGTLEGKEDIRLGQMCEVMKDVAKEEFTKMTAKDIERRW